MGRLIDEETLKVVNLESAIEIVEGGGVDG